MVLVYIVPSLKPSLSVQKPWQRADYDWGKSGWSNGSCNSAAGKCLLCAMSNM